MTDRFELRDKEGNLISEKMMCEHIHVLLDDMKIGPGQEYVVRSQISGYELRVTSQTTA